MLLQWFDFNTHPQEFTTTKLNIASNLRTAHVPPPTFSYTCSSMPQYMCKNSHVKPFRAIMMCPVFVHDIWTSYQNCTLHEFVAWMIIKCRLNKCMSLFSSVQTMHALPSWKKQCRHSKRTCRILYSIVFTTTRARPCCTVCTLNCFATMVEVCTAR